MSIRQMPELLGETEAVLHVFGRYKIFCHFNAAVQIMDLKTHIKWLIYQDNEPHKTKPQNPKETTTNTKNQPPKNANTLPAIYLGSATLTHQKQKLRVASNSKTRTTYKTSNRFPVFPYTLAFPKARSLTLWILFPWLKFHYIEMFSLHSPQHFSPL